MQTNPPATRSQAGQPLDIGDLVAILVRTGNRHDGSGHVTKVTAHHVWVRDSKDRTFRARPGQVIHARYR